MDRRYQVYRTTPRGRSPARTRRDVQELDIRDPELELDDAGSNPRHIPGPDSHESLWAVENESHVLAAAESQRPRGASIEQPALA